MNANPRVRRVKTALQRVIEALKRPAVAAVGLAVLLAYGLGGLKLAVAVLAGAVIVAAVPRLRQRLTKWWLLR